VAALAAAAVMAVVVSRPAAGLKPRATVEQARVTGPVSRPATSELPVAQGFSPAIPVKPVAQPAIPVRPVAQGFSPAIRVAPREPEILIDRREQLALQQLITGARTGRVDLAVAQQNAIRPAMDLDPIADIVIAPLTIDPLAPSSGAEGARQ
jgi:hypothetical protein